MLTLVNSCCLLIRMVEKRFGERFARRLSYAMREMYLVLRRAWHDAAVCD
jgi:hypothetical protein